MENREIVVNQMVVYDYGVNRFNFNGGVLPRVREILDESQFFRTLRVASDGAVYYIDHLCIGVIKRGHFVSVPEFCRWFPRSEIRKVREYMRSAGYR